MNKNNFDEFFREKFREFGEVPDKKVWEAIESSLDKKREKRTIVPIWWKLGGIAAVLAVLFYIVNPFENKTVPAVVNTETKQKENPAKNQEALPGNAVTDKKNEDSKVVLKPQSDSLENPLSSSDQDTETAVIRSANKQFQVSTDKNMSKYSSSNPSAVNRGGELASKQPALPEKAMQDADKLDQAKRLANTPETTEMSSAENKVNKKNIPKGIQEKEGAADKLPEVADNVDKKSIFDEIDQEEEIVASPGENKWSVGPSVAPVYLSSFGEGSPIHSNFVSNSKSGNLNLSYGLSVSYAVSKKLKVRSGVYKVDYGYNTNAVEFSSSLTASTTDKIDNIDYALTSKNLVVQSSTVAEPSQDASFAASNEIAAPSPKREGRMVQQYGYLEVPLELNYALVDRKLGLSLIGGVSSLFLVDNAVSLEANGEATDIGEANNINNLNFSTNIGFGLNYELSPKIQLHLEPMFKYQLNTFSDTSGSFQPFSVGVYSGLNFRF